jgi:hypothetical protein
MRGVSPLLAKGLVARLFFCQDIGLIQSDNS